MRLSAYELNQTKNALLVCPKARKFPQRPEISYREVQIGRQREAQLIAEAERVAAYKSEEKGKW